MRSLTKVISVSTVGVLVALGGCTSASTANNGSSTDSAGSSSAPSVTPSPSDTAPQSAASYWSQHPNLAPVGFADEDVILDVTGTGPTNVRVPDLRSYTSVRLVLRCTAPEKYELTLVGSITTQGIVTGGTNCGVDSGGLNSYVTPRLPASISGSPSVVKVETGANVVYALSVLGVRS